MARFKVGDEVIARIDGSDIRKGDTLKIEKIRAENDADDCPFYKVVVVKVGSARGPRQLGSTGIFSHFNLTGKKNGAVK